MVVLRSCAWTFLLSYRYHSLRAFRLISVFTGRCYHERGIPVAWISRRSTRFPLSLILNFCSVYSPSSWPRVSTVIYNRSCVCACMRRMNAKKRRSTAGQSHTPEADLLRGICLFFNSSIRTNKFSASGLHWCDRLYPIIRESRVR